ATPTTTTTAPWASATSAPSQQISAPPINSITTQSPSPTRSASAISASSRLASAPCRAHREQPSGRSLVPDRGGATMKRIALIATIGLLFWGTPAFAEDSVDFDLDGIGDRLDNCSEASNPEQDDTDLDDCGNLCDADYDQSGITGFGDFGFISNCFGKVIPLCNHTEPVDDPVAFGDFGFFTSSFGLAPGPSGPTAGTTACP
ncbi:MAG: thrombospondin type 3 repeat-containing protein, partial [Deltaproteobacteria bacterium]|nr:thrombospondin type 3 repeat-containing protein [Deltaproteobacteria bacterium]